MKNTLAFFLAQSKYNLKNAYALTRSFWVGVISMMLNNVTFFIIWLLFMKATGPINGWTSLDVFGMLGVSLIIYGIVNSFFRGIADLPEFVVKGTFDSVLLSPVNTFFKLSGASFAVSAYGDLIQGILVTALYGMLAQFSLSTWLLYLFGIVLGSVVFICFRLLCSLVVFFVHDGEVIASQLFELFLRPSLYPGAVFPDTLKLFFMTIIPTLLTSAVPVDIAKSHSISLLLFSLGGTVIWVLLTTIVFKISIRRYESGNLLR